MPYKLGVRGWMSENELKIIEILAQTVPENGTIVEIGSMMGRTACAWAMSAHPSVKIYCLDMWGEELIDSPHNLPLQEIENSGYPKLEDINSIETFRKNTFEFSQIFPIKVTDPNTIPEELHTLNTDLVFIDAGHKNPNDWNIISMWIKKLNQGGILCGHDYNLEFPDVIENVKRLEYILGIKCILYPHTSIWRFDV
jgi:hypothetical protein